MTPHRTLILDGIWGRPRRFGRLRRAIERHCGPAEVFHYNSSGAVSLEILARGLCDQIRSHAAPVNVVGFSMGGIVARTAHLLDPGLPIRRAVFLHVPHAGSLLAHTLPLAAVRQLRPGSELMRRLNDAPWDIPTLVTWCPFDAMVVPGRSANWPNARESIRCDVPLHTWPIWSPSIRERIVQFLAEDDVQRPARSDESGKRSQRSKEAEKQRGIGIR